SDKILPAVTPSTSLWLRQPSGRPRKRCSPAMPSPGARKPSPAHPEHSVIPTTLVPRPCSSPAPLNEGPIDQVQQRRPQERRNVSVRRRAAAVCCDALLGVAPCQLGRTPINVVGHLAPGLGEGPAVGPLPLAQAAFLDAPIGVADRGGPGDRV